MTMKDLLVKHEGIELKPYKDTTGNWTIGVGRNLDDVGISEAEAMLFLDNDIDRSIAYAKCFWWFDGLDPVRRDVVTMMIFNLGPVNFKGFTLMIVALEQGDYRAAAIEMLQSRWASQVGDRAHELSAMMASGQYPEVQH